MPITALFAGLLAPLYIVLALRVIGSRRSAKPRSSARLSSWSMAGFPQTCCAGTPM
jgi:hypothetical protein